MPSGRIYRPTQTDAEHAKQIREIIQQFREVLKQPPPETFLGRKTHDPFPKEEADQVPNRYHR